MNIQPDSQTRGENLFNKTFDGISQRMYGTKKIVRAVLYCVPVPGVRSMPRSVVRPKERALAMLTLSKKARR